jgi:hypothetical protein
VKKSASFLFMFLFGIIIFGFVTVIPQQKVFAACYDVNTKKEIPCSKDDPGKSGYSRRTPVPIPPTKTPVPAATDVPTSTPTFTPTATNTPIPPAGGQAAQLIVPAGLTAPPTNTCDSNTWSPMIGVGILLSLTGLLAQVIRTRSASRGFQGLVNNDYGTSSQANTQNLDVNIGRVDFGDGSGGAPDPTGPVALAGTGIALVVGSGAGILNLVPCSALLGIAGIGILAGLAAGLITHMRARGGMTLFFSGKLKVTGNESLAARMKDDFDQQK